ncbi:hypothetical protein ACFLV1_00075 [Chloroflexota bacterium]
MLQKIRNDLKKLYPSDLCDALIDSYVEIKEQYYLAKHEPSELNGGKFVEACVRIIQEELTNSHVPIGEHIPNIAKVIREFESAKKTKHESFRIHIPRALLLIYNIRNRRGVGHLGGDVNPNLADATIIATTADWIIAEIYRKIYTVSLNQAQEIVNDLVRRKILLVHEIGDVKRVLDPTLSFREQTLLLLTSVQPEHISDDELIKNLEYSNPSRYRSYTLKNLHKDRFIEYSSDGHCTILPPGIRYVESKYSQWLKKLNQGD